MLNRHKSNKFRLLDIIWLLYLSLMMSFNFSGSQQIYTSILLLITIINIIFEKGLRISTTRYKGFIWYSIFAVMVNLSSIWSENVYNYTGITGWVVYISIALFCLDYNFEDNKDSLRFFKIFVIAGAFFSIVVLVTSPLTTYATDLFSGITGQYRTWIGEISVLLLCINFCIYRFYDKSRKYIVFAMLNVITVLATGSRGSLLLTIIVAIYFIAREKNLNRKLLYVIFSIFVCAIAIIVIFRNSALYYAFVERVLGALYNDGSTQSVNERIFFIRKASELFISHPFLGCGVDAMRGYLFASGYWHVTYSHCQYLEILSSYGMVGAILFFLPIIKAIFHKKDSKMVIYVAPIMLIGFIWSVEYYSFIFIILMERLQNYLEE